MHLTHIRPFPETIPLRTAVLCVDCESVSSTRFDKCPVCGSASLFSIAPMLGGSLAEEEARKRHGAVTFNVRINIAFAQIDGAEVSAALSDVTELVGLKLGQTQASLHIDVEPVATPVSSFREKLQAA